MWHPIVAGILAVALFAIWFFEVDTDVGGYVDTWKSKDKKEHFALGAVLTIALMLIGGLSPFVALIYALTAGSLYEVAQKVPTPRKHTHRRWMSMREAWQISWRDIVCDVSGGMVVAGLVILLDVIARL